MNAPLALSVPLCRVDSCDRPRYAKDMCSKHYKRNWRRGSPEIDDIRPSVMTRIEAKVIIDPETDCWIYPGKVDPRQPYAVITDRGRRHYVHRIAWVHFNGPIPEGLEIDHRCRRPRCCNVLHLEPVPHTVNVRRGFSPTITVWRTGLCSAGHDWEANRVQTGERWRCRLCHNARARESYHRVKGERFAA